MRGFEESIRKKHKSGLIPVIPDIKLLSPKEGDLARGRDPAEMARLFESLGAPALSVVTEEKHFGGSVELLKSIALTAGIPVLRKDFITTEEELYITRDAGASAVLLICATTQTDDIRRLYEKAVSMGLEPLVETQNEHELELAAELGATLVGINNRNIATLEKDAGGVERTGRLAVLAPKNACLISESGIETPADAKTAIEAGASGVLVGTALWRARDTASFYLEMCGGGTK
ncbi:MAG: indole-3-glycerol-phosphate synthase [Clostridia bacterium]|nr:indole-3-glycerol-phosphate synthase [Clostridia bacterium]MBQ1374670.1 indole-3-glycerol-phosphate synthase [Clostridia bacterium]